jgi:hypothetical protein
MKLHVFFVFPMSLRVLVVALCFRFTFLFEYLRDFVFARERYETSCFLCVTLCLRAFVVALC